MGIVYAAAALVAFAGIGAGIILSRLSPEEMPRGMGYFPLLQKAILLSLLVFFVNALGLAPVMRLPVYAVAIACALLTRPHPALYFFLGLLFAFSAANPSAFFTVAALVFLYGLPTGSMLAAQERSLRAAVRGAVLRHGSFLVAAAVLPIAVKLL